MTDHPPAATDIAQRLADACAPFPASAKSWLEGTRPDLRVPVRDVTLSNGECISLYEIIDNEVIPLFYDRDATGVPTGRTSRMASCIEALAPQFQAGRMVRDDTLKHYVPAAARAAARQSNSPNTADPLPVISAARAPSARQASTISATAESRRPTGA